MISKLTPEDRWVDWVISLRLVQGIPPGREPTHAEILLAVWFLLDQDHCVAEIVRRSGLERTLVQSVCDLRRAAKGLGQCTALRRARARALRPHWRHLLLIWGHYAKVPAPEQDRSKCGRGRKLVGAGV